MRRPGIVVATGLVAALLLPVSAPVPPAAAADAAVTWTVDQAKKVITVHVRLTIVVGDYRDTRQSPTAPPRGPLEAQEATDAVKAIEKAIRQIWEGQSYKCYSLHVDLTTKIVASLSDFDTDGVSILVLDTRTPTVLDRGLGLHGRKAKPLSEDPSDAVHPVTGSQGRFSVWPVAGSMLTFGSLFGQVIGLDSTLSRQSGPVTGAAEDVMSGSNPGVNPTTMTRLIRRSGLDVSKLKCAITADLPFGQALYTFNSISELGFHLHACDYDPPSADPANPGFILFEGTILTKGNWDVFLVGSGTAGGTSKAHSTFSWGSQTLDVFSGKLVVYQPVIAFASGLVSTSPAYFAGAGPLLDGAEFQFKEGSEDCK